jgi:Kef-type K+ transport system membrane component KefB
MFTPLTNPVAIFTLIILVILFVPFFSKQLKMPAIFGLILSGLVIGPNGSGLIPNNEGVSVFASVGLLYIMFLAGLEININSFFKTKNKSIIFGIATFIIPLILGFPVLYYFLNFSFLAALLVASMFSTHTLLSYPIVSKLNITNRESVIVTIGGTIFTDTAVLVLLSVITTAHNGDLSGTFWIQLIILLAIFVFLVLWGLPKLARWYFNTFQSDSISQYVFVLSALFVSAMLAKWAGIEPIVGAFLSGLALNRVIPHHSPLMNRTVFIGNAIFIPFFLISVGMLVDLKVLFNGFDTLIISSILIAIAISGKFIAAFVTQIIFKYSKTDRNLIFGLSSSHAAATLAIILVGYELHILDEKVLNGTILLILATSMVSAFITDHSARIIAIEEADGGFEQSNAPERIILPVANPSSFRKLMDIALLSKQQDADTTIYPLSIVNDDGDAHVTLLNNKKTMDHLMQQAAATDTIVSPITRVDINIPAGISRTVKELFANRIIMGWSGRSSTATLFFGNIIDNLLETTRQMVMVVRFYEPKVLFTNILVLVPANADKEVGFYGWVNAAIMLSKNTGGKLIFLSNSNTLSILRKRLKEFKMFDDSNFIPFEFYPNVSALPVEFSKEDLLITIASRPSTISFNRRQIIIPKLISRLSEEMNSIVIYPEQVEKPNNTLIGVDSF